MGFDLYFLGYNRRNLFDRALFEGEGEVEYLNIYDGIAVGLFLSVVFVVGRDWVRRYL